MKTVTFDIEGMHCEGCAETIRGVLSMQEGVKAAEVSFAGRSARLLFDPWMTDEQQLVAAIRGLGFRVLRAAEPVDKDSGGSAP